MKTNKEFPNGFESWYETFFELSQEFHEVLRRDNLIGEIKNAYESHGRGAIYELAEQWTDEFEKINEDREWDGEFYDEIEDFFHNKNN